MSRNLDAFPGLQLTQNEPMMPAPTAPKVAIVHDWLTVPGGAERVLEQMLLAFPNADLFTVCDFLEEKHRYLLTGRIPKTTFIQKLPFARTKHWVYLPLMPLAIEQLDLSAYDLVLSSSYCVAKGVLTGPDQTHISYIYTPIRYAWHLQHQYLKELRAAHGPFGLVVRALLHYLRIWDLRSAVGVTNFFADSHYVAKQVRQLYKQDCEVLYPPVDLERFTLEEEKEDYYVTASRLVPYKKIDLVVKAFARMPDRKLIVIGDGPERERVEKAAEGHSNIKVLGYQSDESLQRHIGKARAFVFAAIEDFGIAPLEAQACGTPVIALGRGGSLETVVGRGREAHTGVFFDAQTEDSIIAGVRYFETIADEITPHACRANAERFSTDTFRERLLQRTQEILSS